MRDRNEDTLVAPGLISIGTLTPPVSAQYLGSSEPFVFAVVDGMGGHRSGARASRLIAEELADVQEPSAVDRLERANRKLFDEMGQSPELTGMGATVAGAILYADQATVFNVGDARVYHVSGGYMALASRDDRVARNSSVVTQSLGGTVRPVAIEPHVSELALKSGDRILVCSDGLSDVVAFETIDALVRGAEPYEAVAALLQACLDAGAPDNVSIIVLHVTYDPRRQEQQEEPNQPAWHPALG